LIKGHRSEDIDLAASLLVRWFYMQKESAANCQFITARIQ